MFPDFVIWRQNVVIGLLYPEKEARLQTFKIPALDGSEWSLSRSIPITIGERQMEVSGQLHALAC
jgi:hypothetical protein